MKKRFSDKQIISILREAEAGVSARELCRGTSFHSEGSEKFKISA